MNSYNTAAQNMAAEVPVVSAPTPMTDSLVMNEALEKLGEKLGEFKAYDSQLPITEIVHTRIVKCLYQINPKTQTKAQDNAFVRIPTKHLTEEHIVASIAELSPHILAWLQGIESKDIQDYHRKGGLTVYTAGLSLDKIIEKLEASSEGSRLNKEKIEAWYNAELLETLTVLFADKMQITNEATEQELEKLELVLGAYRAKFASLASGKVFIKEDDCIAMIKVIQTCDSATSSLIGSRFIARLTKMQEKEDDTLMSLGL